MNFFKIVPICVNVTNFGDVIDKELLCYQQELKQKLAKTARKLHVIQRGNNRDPIFAADDDYRFYLHCLMAAAVAQCLTIHAYVLMTNHVHLLVTPETESSLPKTMQSIGRHYVQYFNHT